MRLKNVWWKVVCIMLLFYVAIAGLLMPVPHLDILNETIRNLYFHVPMWFGQIVIFTVGLVNGLIYVSNRELKYDIRANAANTIGMLYGCMGLMTGMLWAKFTWGSFWSSDPKLNSTAIAMLIYAAYFVLRSSFTDIDKRAQFAAIYSIFSFVMYNVLIFVIPRMKEFSVHPGNGGNPGFAAYDLDAKMRMVFYPAVLGWSLLAVWIYTLLSRYRKVKTDFLMK